MMSSPYSPENQQPYQPQQGGYPQQGGDGQQPTQQMPVTGGYGQQQTQQMPVTGGYGQQQTQQMPVAGGYGQPQGYGQQAQQGYYAQGQFQGAPGAARPPQKKTGLIIGIIAAVLVIALIAGVAVWALIKGHSSSDETSASPSTAAPTYAPSAAPSPSSSTASTPTPTRSTPPVGSKSSPTPTQGTSSSGSLSADEEYGVKNECKSALSQTVQKGTLENWTVQRDGVDSSGRPQYLSKGQFNGTLLTGKSGTFNFTCTAVYHQDKGVYEAWTSIDAY